MSTHTQLPVDEGSAVDILIIVVVVVVSVSVTTNETQFTVKPHVQSKLIKHIRCVYLN